LPRKRPADYKQFAAGCNPNIVGALALPRAALLKIFNHFRPIDGSPVATLENIRADQSSPLNVICKKLA